MLRSGQRTANRKPLRGYDGSGQTAWILPQREEAGAERTRLLSPPGRIVVSLVCEFTFIFNVRGTVLLRKACQLLQLSRFLPSSQVSRPTFFVVPVEEVERLFGHLV